MRRLAHAAMLVHAMALVATLFITQTFARADALAGTTTARDSASPKVAVKHSPDGARARSTDDQSLYACHPKDDLSCTVIRETAKGIVVVTFRPSGAKETRVWSVVNAPPEAGSAATGRTIYVVPGEARPVSEVQPTTQVSENNAPILD